MEKYSDALKRSMEKRKLVKGEEKLDAKNNQNPQYRQTEETIEENIGVAIERHQASHDTHNEPNFTRYMKDTKPNQLGGLVNRSKSKIKFKKPHVELNEIHERLMFLRKENSKQTFKKSKVKKPFFNRKRKENLFTFYKPNSLISESFKFIRTFLLNATKEKNIKTILVTSALPEEGKSFVSSNLSVSIASGLDQHVLLVNVDDKKPSLDEIFKIDSELGLSDYLINEKYNLSNLIQKTKVKKLSYLPAGTCYENNSELFSSEVMKMFILELKYRYEDRYIIFDAPPAKVSQTLGIADKVDGVILVVKSGKTEKKLIKETAQLIGIKKNIGVVLNQFNLKSIKYYKYYK